MPLVSPFALQGALTLQLCQGDEKIRTRKSQHVRSGFPGSVRAGAEANGACQCHRFPPTSSLMASRGPPGSAHNCSGPR